MELMSLPEASTIIPVRQGRGGVEVYLVRRSARAGFMAGNYVFPGGVLDPADRDAQRWADAVDLGPTELGERLGEGLSWERILAFGVAAIRETFEEAGVFLGETGSAEGLSRVLEQRRAGLLGKEWLVEETASRGWRLAFSALNCWAWWVTPAGMSRRYDTRFFLASCPADQVCSPDGREVVEGVWTTARAALAANLTGAMPLSPPAAVTLQELLRFDDEATLLAGARTRTWGSALAPRLVIFEGGPLLVEPWDPEYSKEELVIDPERLQRSVLPVGEPFSRLWSDAGVWRPVAAG